MIQEDKQLKVFVTVFQDVVKVEVEELLRRQVVGWFLDEVSAIGAVCERAIIQSAMFPGVRQMPRLAVHCEYRNEVSGHSAIRFSRGTRTKLEAGQRRVVLLSWASIKPWIPMERGY